MPEDYIDSVYADVQGRMAELDRLGASSFFYVQHGEKVGFCSTTGGSPEALGGFLVSMIDENPEMVLEILAAIDDAKSHGLRSVVGNYGFSHYEERLLGMLSDARAYEEDGTTEVLWCHLDDASVSVVGAGYVQDKRLYIVETQTPMDDFCKDGRLLEGVTYRESTTGKAYSWSAAEGRLTEATQEG